MISRRLVFPVLAIALADCLGADDEETTVVDTRIASRVLTVGDTGTGPPSSFERPVAASLLPDGSIAVADEYAGHVRFFDSLGQQTSSAGRLGQGPGEFGSIAWMSRCGSDSLFVWDRLRSLMTVLTGQGIIVRQYQIPHPDPGGPRPALLSCNEPDRLAFIAQPRPTRIPTPQNPVVTMLAPVAAASTDGSVRVLVSEVSAAEARPLGRVTRIATTQHGIYLGAGMDGSIVRYTWEGDSAGVFDLDIGPRPATTLHYERAIELQVSGLRDRDERAQMQEILRRVPMPEQLPSITELFADANANLWAVLSSPGDSATLLRGLTSAGRIIGDIVLPGEVRVLDVGVSHVLGAIETPSGTAVALFRWSRPWPIH